MNPTALLDTPAPERVRRSYHAGFAIAVIAVIFAAVAPTLTWPEFSTADESLNVATALETTRQGNWLVPTFQGHAQVARPPLAAWFTALVLPARSTAALHTSDVLMRQEAYRHLAWDTRWPSLFSSCLALVAVFSLGRSIGGTRIGVLSVVVCGISGYFLRYARQATTDTQLFFWVSVTNAFLAEAVLERMTWRNMLGAGVAAGLAVLSKGPIALALTALPTMSYLAWRAWIREERDPLHWRHPARRRRWMSRATAAVALVLVSFAWYGWAEIKVPGAVALWEEELGGGRMTSIWRYGTLLTNMLPWTLFFMHGAAVTVVETAWTSHLRWIRWFGPRLEDEAVRERWALPVFLLLVPVFVMMCGPHRTERDLLPLAPAAAILAARSVALMLDAAPYGPAIWPHWLILLVIGVAGPIAGGLPLTHSHGQRVTLLRTVANAPWYTPSFAVAACAAVVGVVFYGIRMQKRRRISAVIAGMIVMLFTQAIFVYGYSKSRSGCAEMRSIADAACQKYSECRLFNVGPERRDARAEAELSIYADRIVRWSPSLSAVPPSGRPAIAVMRQENSETVPPPGWRRLIDCGTDEDFVAFVRVGNALH